MQNLRQTAYEVHVASSQARLREGKGDVWDSGRVSSGAQYGVTYGGRPLTSGQEVWWSVRTWDQAGTPSEWSKPARIVVGLLDESDWKGRWIGWRRPASADEAESFQGASWIWSAAEDPLNAPALTRSVERSFDLTSLPRQASLRLTADDRFVLSVNGQEVRRSTNVADGWRIPVTVDLRPHLRLGTNSIKVEATNGTPSPAGVIAKLTMVGEDGARTTLVTDGSWRADGAAAKVAAPYGQGPWGRFADPKTLPPTTVYSRPVEVRPGLVRAVAHVTALGLVDLAIDGKRVSEDLFTPGWTNYRKRVYARTFDVTQLLRNRKQAGVTLEVGDGWYSGYVGYSRQRAHYGERPLVRAQIELEYADGRRETVATDGTWNVHVGNTISQDFLAGEEFDARPKKVRSFTAIVEEGVQTKVEPFPGVPVRPYARLKPVKITRQGDGYMLDFGQNLAGFARLSMRGKAGQRVQIQFVEALNPDGTLYTANLRSATQTDAYTFAGSGVETWEPRFTFHGFRYAKVTGLDRAPRPEEIQAVAISSATPETGTFESSDPMINRLSQNAWWTQKMNFIDIPTDCPQRDERLGWTGDAQVYIRTAATYSDVQAFFEKWLVTLEDEQRKDGQFPQFAPTVMGGDDGGPAWADAGVICPWTIYEMYGDERLLRERYPSMKKFVEWCVWRSGSDLLPPKQTYHIFGDWLSINANTPQGVIYEAYFAHSTQLLGRAARVLGYREDAERYERLFGEIKTAFNRAYVTPIGVVAGDTQTAYVLALGFGLLDGDVKRLAAERLVKNIEDRKWHLSTGFVGTRDLMRVLTEIGREDVAFRLLHNTTFPSWGFEIVNGATTIWERWDGWTPERGFQDPGMNSFAHYAYGAVMGWVMSTIGGIDTAKPGFETIRIAPRFDPKMNWAKTSYDSIRGPVRTEWRRSGARVNLTVEVPPNTTAEIVVPGGETKRVGSGVWRFVGLVEATR